ncbi:FN3 associated domain-containing protein [Paenibacillus sp. BR2-3]|uniref:FN3 associated domain-containing protein n=1 Tax=Paenibacillus sp. BR2-3 TaxID=3048494 RepID=UPI003977A75F
MAPSKKKALPVLLTTALATSLLSITPPGAASAATAANVPGLIEAEYFTTAPSFTSTIGTSQTASQGLALRRVIAGDEFNYLINAAAAGTYKVVVNFGAQVSETAAFSLRDSAGKVLHTFNIPATGGVYNWSTVTGYVNLPAGQQTLTLYCDKGGYNIDSFQFTPVTNVNPPTADSASGTYASTVNVKLADDIPGAQIYYTTDGSTPIVTSDTNGASRPGNASTILYVNPIAVASATSIHAAAVRSGLANSDVATFNYAIDPNAKAAAPVASRVTGTYGGTQSVTLSSTSSNAKIYYTTDGTTPAASVTGSTKLYSTAVAVSSSTTLKAITVADSLNSSDVSVFTYNIISATPTSDIATGVSVPDGVRATLSSTTAGAKMYYTTDGSDPTASSMQYTGPIGLTGSIAANRQITIKAIAVSPSLGTSSITTLSYTIDPALVKLTDAISIPGVIRSMTLQEKADLVSGNGVVRIPGAAGGSKAIPRLGIPGTTYVDGPAGVRISAHPEGWVDSSGNPSTRYATQWPNATARAATWNTSLELALGTAFGRETHYFGADLLLAPAVNLHRSVLNGRNFEYYSEDPVLSGKMAAAEINGIESQGVGAAIKHFSSNAQETQRSNGFTNVSGRTLREIELRSFEIAIKESQPEALMTAYNHLNGVSTAQNSELTNTVLRDEWGFKGFAMTDWNGQGNASYWAKQAGNNPYSSNLKAGVDIGMPNGDANKVIEGINSGFLTMAELDKGVKNILEFVVTSLSFKGEPANTEPNPHAEQHESIAYQTAVESMVLLKNGTVNNKQVLPLKSGNITTIGNASTDMVRGGDGSGGANIDTSKLVQLPQALSAIYKGGSVIDTSSKSYAQVPSVLPIGGFSTTGAKNEMQITDSQMDDLVKNTDSIIMTIARGSSEGSDIQKKKGAYYISDAERDLINKASAKAHAAGKLFIVVLNLGSPIEMESWMEKADAILLAWEPGTVLAKPVAAVLTGAANPSGKLPTTIPVDVTGKDSKGYLYSPAVDFGQTNGQGGVAYNEGIYNGYRYYDTFNVPVSYEFGYGKNYSTFKYSNLKLSSATFKSVSDTMNVKVDVKNTSAVTGKEAVQIYVGAPGKSMDKPVKELKAFAKTNDLAGNASQTLNFTLDAKSLASFDEARSAWVVEPGTFVVYAAASSKDIRQVATFKVTKEIIADKVHDVLNPIVKLNLIKPASNGQYVTKAEFINMLVQAFDWMDESAVSKLTDVKKGSLYYGSIATAQKLGVVNGKKDGSFGVNDPISRQDMAVIMFKAAQKLNVDLKGSKVVSPFTDNAKISPYAKDAVAVLQKSGVINGMSGGLFMPNGTTTKDQAIVTIYRLVNVVK